MIFARRNSILVLLMIAVLQLACSSNPVADRSTRWDPQAYTVRKGDTLYSIAWRYEKDYRQIAAWNNIGPPYAIYPGQRLQMQPASQDGSADVDKPRLIPEPVSGKLVVEEAPSAQSPQPYHRPEEVIVKQDETLYSIARREGLSHHQLARWNHLRSPYILKPGQKLRLRPPAAALGSSHRQHGKKQKVEAEQPVVRPLKRDRVAGTPVKAHPANQPRALPTKIDHWQWPIKGRVVKTFRPNDTSRKGIGIRGKPGQIVKAAAAGTVVYSGNGLINYGNLVIIKHSHSFLSAYAYNSSLLVKEGDSVKSGQAIAKMGRADSSKPQLHFEIRRNGKPVNPLNYLPRS